MEEALLLEGFSMCTMELWGVSGSMLLIVSGGSGRGRWTFVEDGGNLCSCSDQAKLGAGLEEE